MHTSEIGHYSSAHHDVVEMSNHEIRIRQVDIKAKGGQDPWTPATPPQG